MGAPRSGTTSLSQYLNQHPQVRMSARKEPAYFHFVDTTRQPDFALLARIHGNGLLAESKENYHRAQKMAITSPDKYSELWSNASTNSCKGEATPTYLFDPVAMTSIRERLTSCKGLIILRNPVERAYSEYLQHLGKGFEKAKTFAEALSLEPVEVDDFWWGSRSYVRSGLYVDHVLRAFALFGSENIFVLLTDDLANDPHGTLGEIATFLDIDSEFDFDTSTRHNPAHVPNPDLAVRLARSQSPIRTIAHRVLPDSVRSKLWRRVMRRREAEIPEFDSQSHSSLASIFIPSVSRLAKVIDRDLAHWIS